MTRYFADLWTDQAALVGLARDDRLRLLVLTSAFLALTVFASQSSETQVMAVLLALLVCVVVILARHMGQLTARTEALQESEARLAAIVAASLDGVIVIDGLGEVLAWNKGAETCFGISTVAALGRKFSDLVVPQRHLLKFEAAICAAAEVQLDAQIAQRLVLDAKHALGFEFPIDLSFGAVDEASPRAVVVFVRDITETRLRETELHTALNLAEAASRSKAAFLAVMSHEMRTPLNGVIGSLDLLSRTPLMGQQQHFVDTALRSGELLLAQINDVLDISKLDVGKLMLEYNVFNLIETVRSVLDIVEPLAASAGNSITLDLDPELPQAFNGDAMRISQILLNLVSNAVKFTNQGCIAISVRQTACTDRQATIEFAVCDNGIGIEAGRIGDLFQDFSVIDPSYSRRVGGTGLGLAISKRLVNALGGQIGVTSQIGAGSRFWFQISLVEAVGAAQVHTIQASPASGLAQSLDILLVEDNATNQMVARLLLTAEGHHVETAVNGRHAIDIASRRDFDLIFMDISMPDIDGLEATRCIRSLPGAISLVPIVALTAHAVAGDRDRFLAAGFTDYLAKPIRRNELLAAIANAYSAIPAPEADNGLLEEKLLNAGELEALARDTSIEMLPEIISQFLNDTEIRWQDLTRASQLADVTSMRQAAHALAGVAATMGAQRMARQMRRIETLCVNNMAQQATSLVRTSETLISETSAAYQTFKLRG